MGGAHDRPAEDFRRRLGRVQAAMADRGLDGLLLYASGQHTMLRMDQVHYLSDVRVIGPHAVLVVPRQGDPGLLLTPRWDRERARELTWLAEVEAVDPGELAARAASRCRDITGSLGLGGREGMPAGLAEALRQALGRPLADAGDLLPSLAAARTPLELERVRSAAAIADEGFRVLCETARAGMPEHELAAEVEAAMQGAGSEDNFGMIAAGSHNIAVRPPTDRRLESGDIIIGEITPCYRGYFAQLCRTLVLGPPTPLLREKFDLLLLAHERALAATLPGRPSAEIARAVNAVIGGAGYAEYCRQPYMRTRGHGLGFGAVVPYDLTEDARPELAEGMTFVVHPNQYLPETGYLMLGDTVAVRPGGPERLTRTPLRLFSTDA
jgi:Xaa-Pro aminopeptidase